jgi:hypothetical protein
MYERAGVEIRLALLCEREGHEPWTLPVEIPAPSIPST